MWKHPKAASSWLIKHTEIIGYLAEAKKSLDRLKHNVKRIVHDNLYGYVVQNRLRQILNVVIEIEESLRKINRLKAEMVNVADITGNHQVLDDARIDILRLERLAVNISTRFAHLHQSYKLGYVTLTEQQSECILCPEDLSGETVVRECPICDELYHSDCISRWLTQQPQPQPACLSCSCFIHL